MFLPPEEHAISIEQQTWVIPATQGGVILVTEILAVFPDFYTHLKNILKPLILKDCETEPVERLHPGWMETQN